MEKPLGVLGLEETIILKFMLKK